MIFTTQQRLIVAWCADQCARQHSGERSVARMVEAYHFADLQARERGRPLDREAVTVMAYRIDREANRDGTRRIPTAFADATVLPWETVDRALDNLLAARDRLTPEAWYREFEAIHPFEDGNGRLGALLYNLLAGTLDHPRNPPEYRATGSAE